MMEPITAVSLFNGPGGLLMALNELNIPIEKLYVSEIDKFANKAADLLYDKNIHLGCVTNLRRATCWKLSTLVKAFNSKYLSDKTKEKLAAAMDLRGQIVDILTAGFPCQAWSLAGKQSGDSDPRGALVHDMLKLWAYLANINPDIKFMFENVSMKKEFMTYINDLFKCEPTKINAALLTAQNRDRNYWSNWNIYQPDDLGIILADILDDFHGQENRPCKMREVEGTGICRHVADATDLGNYASTNRVYSSAGKAPTLNTMGGGHREPKVLMKSRARGFNKGFERETKKTGTLTACAWEQNNHVSVNDGEYRKLTPTECMRLQGWPAWVIDILISSDISATQLRKMTGNGWAHPVIVHNLQCLLNTGWIQDDDQTEWMEPARKALDPSLKW